MNTYITEFEKIKEELKVMDDFLSITMSEDANEAIQRGNDLSVHLARSGKLVADAKYHKDLKLKNGVVQELKSLISLPPSTANKYIESLCYEENQLVSWADRVNRACTHQLDWCRTVVSKAKAEMTSFNPR